MESSGSEKQPVRVTILGKSYTLLASGDPREVEEVAASVDELMHSIREKLPTADPTRIAVLACMHLADQLRLGEKELGELRQRKDTRSGEYAAMLDRLISTVEELAV
jgi:cell division protein ZapA